MTEAARTRTGPRRLHEREVPTSCAAPNGLIDVPAKQAGPHDVARLHVERQLDVLGRGGHGDITARAFARSLRHTLPGHGVALPFNRLVGTRVDGRTDNVIQFRLLTSRITAAVVVGAFSLARPATIKRHRRWSRATRNPQRVASSVREALRPQLPGGRPDMSFLCVATSHARVRRPL